MLIKVFLGAIVVGWGLAAVLMGVVAIQNDGQAAQYQETVLISKTACDEGQLDACTQELDALFKQQRASGKADLYKIALVDWAIITVMVAVPVVGAHLRERRRSQPPQPWASS